YRVITTTEKHLAKELSLAQNPPPMEASSPDTIVARFQSWTGQWVAYFVASPKTAFGGNLPFVAVRRLLEGTGADADTYQLIREDDREPVDVPALLLTWEPPEILFDCQECGGTGQYVGLKEVEPCRVCGGRKLQTA